MSKDQPPPFGYGPPPFRRIDPDADAGIIAENCEIGVAVVGGAQLPKTKIISRFNEIGMYFGPAIPVATEVPGPNDLDKPQSWPSEPTPIHFPVRAKQKRWWQEPLNWAGAILMTVVGGGILHALGWA